MATTTRHARKSTTATPIAAADATEPTAATLDAAEPTTAVPDTEHTTAEMGTADAPAGNHTTGATSGDEPSATETSGTDSTDPAPSRTPDLPTADGLVSDTTTGGSNTTDDRGSDAPPDAPVSGIPVSGVPVSGAPVGTADHFKVVMVAGVLGDHPDGVSAADVVDESGLRAAIVGRVLAAMETAGAATRKPTDETDAAGVELWLRGDAELTAVDLSAAAVREVCPTCQRPMPRRTTVSVGRTGTAGPGQNSNGQRTLAKNELRTMVRDFLAAHPGHEFTPTTLGRELGRSSGAVSNALSKLVVSGEALMVNEAPAIYSAPPAAPQADTAPAAGTAAK